MESYLDRSKQLIGDDTIKGFEDKTILVIGLGGVGGTALNTLFRSGFKHFIIVDHDTVKPSNLNRQIMYNYTDIDRKKVDVCCEYIKNFNSDIEVITLDTFFEKSTFEILKNYKIDFVIDAIDSVASKLDIVEYCLINNIPFISSMGMANRLDPNKVVITNLSKTSYDPLAKKMRAELRKRDIDISKVNVIFSLEEPILRGKYIASMMFVPSMAGLLIGKYIVTTFMKETKK